MSQNESLFDILKLLYNWRKQILLASFLVALCTAGVSLLLPNYYQSSTSFYAASPDLAKPVPVGANPDNRFMYGTDNDVDRLFSIGRARPLMDFLIQEFNLFDHYEIKKEEKLAKHKLSKKFNKLFKITKTKFDAIEISIEDKDPELCTKMANAARERINLMAQQVIKDSQKKQMATYKASITQREGEYKVLLDSLNRMKTKFNIFSSDAQGESYGATMVEVEGNYLKAASKLEFLKSISAPRDSISKAKVNYKGLEQQFKKLKTDVGLFNEGYPIVKNLERMTRDVSAEVSVTKTRLSAMQSAYDANISAIHLVEAASTPIYKSRPKRSILVVGAAMITFILMSLWVVVTDQIKNKSVLK